MKDFLLHLLTITIGLLIAVGIEGLVELHREHRLANEARATMREEIEHNHHEMSGFLIDMNKQKASIQRDVESLTKILVNPKDKEAQKANIDATFRTIGLRDTAWKTAQTTGALTFMPYTEAQRYSNVYSSQEEFLRQQDKILEDEAQFMGIIRKTNFGHGITTRDQAAMALERFGIWQGHLLYLDLMARGADQTQQAFLEGRNGPRDLHEDMK